MKKITEKRARPHGFCKRQTPPKKRGKTILAALCLILVLSATPALAETSLLHFYAHDNGTPLEGVTYVATNTNTGETYTNTTDSTGWTTLTVPTGNYTVTAHSPYGTETRTLSIDETGEYNFQTGFTSWTPGTFIAPILIAMLAAFIVAVLFIMWMVKQQKETALELANSKSARNLTQPATKNKNDGVARNLFLFKTGGKL